ncbi:unnamed protein product [Miscanthus lutarioriparius]|uniref:Uncharacterized protein n=1 Tax=Miscanthus lutarioriparius TaxID=422564 RepID=A0A811PNU4_9POAL|nr:unnamed protein product [Miscanthus lutarioriparius]
MTPSRKNISVAMLLIVIVAAVCPLCSMAFACEVHTECRHLSGNYEGPCWGFDDSCGDTCIAESSENKYGYCDCDFKCWCYTC